MASCFFLYAIKILPLNHPIFHYVEGFEYPNAFTRKHTIAYEEEIKKLWSAPQDLIKFLEKTELCNPFAAADINEKEKLHIREEGIFSPADYDLLGELFENNVSCEKIITIFLNTFLKKRLVMEELLYISETFNRLDEMLAALKNVCFEGFIEKYNIGDLVISPKEYYCKQLHVVVLNAVEFKYFNEDNENDTIRTATAIINEHEYPLSKRKNRKNARSKYALLFAVGAICGALICTLGFIIF